MKPSLREIFELDDPPRRIALALAVGVFISCTPFWGLHTLLSIAVATLLRLNRAVTVTGTWLNLPWFAPFVYGTALAVGALIVPGAAHAPAASLADVLHTPGSLSWRSVLLWANGVSLRLLAGTTVVGLVAALVTYVVALNLIALRRRRPTDREGSGSSRPHAA